MYILVYGLERTWLATAVAHASVIETENRVPCGGEIPGQQDELAMAANPVLWATDDD